MTISKNSARLSATMAWLAMAGAIFYPALTILCFFFPDQTRVFDMDMEHLGAPLTGAVPFVDRMCALAVELVPIALVVWALIGLARVFRWFAEGEVFSLAALTTLRRVAWALFLSVVANFVAQAPISLFLTYWTPHEHRIVSLGFGSPDVAMLFLAGSTVVVARVLAEARRLALENQSFV